MQEQQVTLCFYGSALSTDPDSHTLSHICAIEHLKQ